MRSPSPAALSVIGTSLRARSTGDVPVIRIPCIFTYPSCCLNDHHSHVTPMIQSLAFVSVISNPMHLQSPADVSVVHISCMFTFPSCCTNDQRACVFTVPSYREWTLRTIHRRPRGPAFPFNKWTQQLMRSGPNAFYFLRLSFQTYYRSSDIIKWRSVHPT